MQWFTAGIVFLLGAGATASDSVPQNPFQGPPAYLSAQAISSDGVLPPPPGAHSNKAAKDFAEILKLQRDRSKQECARAGIEVHVSLETFFGPKFGPLSEGQVVKWNPLFLRVRHDAEFIIQREKRHWKRPRPYVADGELHPCVPLETTNAYPSGHAANAQLFADILSLLEPAHKKEFEARADQIARDRVLAGVHHPTDIKAGKTLGDAIFRSFMNSEKFRQDLEKTEAAGDQRSIPRR